MLLLRRAFLAGSMRTAFSMHISWVYELKLVSISTVFLATCKEGEIFTLGPASWHSCKEQGTTCRWNLWRASPPYCLYQPACRWAFADLQKAEYRLKREKNSVFKASGLKGARFYVLNFGIDLQTEEVSKLCGCSRLYIQPSLWL